ncbi:hypothetical protein HPB47_004064 [Ixodes persulcatus]|uniref:Uncharacterized protein n=1 Tax=Ixodes persulcatus TaxID=34615 RepID=A0AC60PI16_IXOPE|nr:hypothetical protein HPB47_004064 [Ixodes persulcatus]
MHPQSLQCTPKCPDTTLKTLYRCSLSRSECERQTRLYRECLFIRLQDRANPYRSDARWPGVTKTTPAAENKVHKLGGTDLPKQVERVLCQGPKFAVEPKKTSPELLSMQIKKAALLLHQRACFWKRRLMLSMLLFLTGTMCHLQKLS